MPHIFKYPMSIFRASIYSNTLTHRPLTWIEINLKSILTYSMLDKPLRSHSEATLEKTHSKNYLISKNLFVNPQFRK